MAIKDNWTYKDVQELKLAQRKDKNYLPKYKVYCFADSEEIEVIKVRKLSKQNWLSVRHKLVAKTKDGQMHYGEADVFLPLDTKFHVRKEVKE